MAERSGSRRRSSRDAGEATGSRTVASAVREKRGKRPTKTTKERWLLTRKTWRYMADAGRKLIPEGAHNRADDIPKIEEYFQEMCQKEPTFLLLRKASYQSSLGFRTHRRRRPGKGGSCRVKASSADEAEETKARGVGRPLFEEVSGGRFNITKMKRDWLTGGSTPTTPVARRKGAQQEDDAEAKVLADMLQKYLNMRSSDNATSEAGGGAGGGCDAGGNGAGGDRGSGSSPGPGKTPPSSARGSHSGVQRSTEPFEYQCLIEKLQKHLDLIMAEGRRREASAAGGTSGQTYEGDYVHKSLLDTLGRYYGKSSNHDHVISNILTDRKLLEKLYFDLRCTRGFRGPRATGAYSSTPSSSSQWRPSTKNSTNQGGGYNWSPGRRDLTSPPPLIAVQGPSTDRGPVEDYVQTDPVSKEVLETYLVDIQETSSKDHSKGGSLGRRKSSVVESVDVSPSVSDTIKRYLRMARKKSIDCDKVDRFKRVNYDRNLRNIKAKGEITKISDDDGNNKGSQTEDNWVINYREMSDGCCEQVSDVETASPGSHNASSRSSIDAGIGSEETSPSTPKHHQSFLSHLLHGSNAHKDKPHSAPGSPAMNTSNSVGGAAMQKSKSSSSVVHHGSRLVAKKIWRSRSKSTSRASNQPSVWTPQGKCTWAGTGGRRVTLQDTSLRALSDVERRVLCQVAVAKLQALNLGVHIRPPTDTLGGSVTTKPKRRAHLLKRKALTTGFFDSKGKDEKDKESSGGLVFGIPLSQCLENDRLAKIAAADTNDVGSLMQSSRHGSRASFTSLIEAPSAAAQTEDGGSCESLPSKDSGMLELSDSGGSGPPGEWDSIPAVVQQCIKHLIANGLHTLGVFRVSPSKKRVRQLREDFDCGRESRVGPDQCPHDVAALLKEFFRDLPDPLLCRDLYQAFVHTQKIRNRRLQQEALQHLIQLLPAANRDTLWALLNFLGEVAANSEDRKSETGEWISGNKMDINNLATVFAPNILHCVKPGQTRPEISAERAEERIDVINVVRTLLENSSVLFTVPAALLDELYLHMMDTHPAELDLALTRRVDEQCGDEVDPCSETETFSEEGNLTPRRIWTREECMHQTAGVGGDIGPKPRRPKRPGSRRKDESRSNSIDSGSSEDPTDPRRISSPMVITASLTIPMSSAFTLNLDDSDIPYIEEGPKQQRDQPEQQQQPSAPPRRQRQRSISNCSEGGRHGSDSAVGSSVTHSGDQPPSSPPSWASSPPASPDSTVTAVSYLPDQQAVLQRVSFTTSSEVRQISRSTSHTSQPNTPILTSEAVKTSAGSYTPSITSIGGAVLRSKTADIERMLRLSRPEPQPQLPVQSQSNTTSSNSTSSDNKKYTKRRYTDLRHQTQHIPDAATLAAESTPAPPSTRDVRSTTAPIWKRRELISSAPKDRKTYF